MTNEFMNCCCYLFPLWHDDGGYRRVAHYVFADAALDGVLEARRALRSDDDQIGLLLVGNAADSFADVLHCLAAHLVLQLKQIFSIHNKSQFDRSLLQYLSCILTSRACLRARALKCVYARSAFYTHVSVRRRTLMPANAIGQNAA